MIFQYELSVQDYRDAMSAHVSRTARRAQRRNLVPATILGVCMALYVLINFTVVSPAAPSMTLAGDFADSVERFRGILLPMILIGFLGKLRRFQGKPTAWVWAVAISVLYVALFAVPTLLILGSAGDSGDLVRAIDPSIPWVLVTMFVAWAAIAAQRRALRAAWESQPNLRAAKTVTVHDEGVRVEYGFVCTDYKWLAFRQVAEGTTVLLIYTADNAFLIIPKRSMNQEDQTRLREVLRERVENRPNAFPVLPLTISDTTAVDAAPISS